MANESVMIFNSTQSFIEGVEPYTSLSIFNLKDVSKQCKDTVSPLAYFNELLLSPQESIVYKHETDMSFIILPIKGTLSYQDQYNKEIYVDPEELLAIQIAKGKMYTIHNPYPNEWINYLHIGFQNQFMFENNSFAIETIALKKMNELVPINLPYNDHFIGQLGIYDGRAKDYYALKKKDNTVFIYVMNGIFEVQGRLLERKSGLSLKNLEEIEFEALSNNAILLLLEIKSNNY